MLGLSLHGWENAMVVLLIVAGFAAFAAGVATWAVVRLQRIELTRSEKEFAKYKLDTAKEISEANARAAEANARTAETEERIQKRRMSRALFFSIAACKEILQDKPTGRVEILWEKHVPDGPFLAQHIALCLNDDSGLPLWKLDRTGPVDELPEEASETGITVIGRVGGSFIFKRPSDALPDVIGSALLAAVDPDLISVTFGHSPSIADDLVRIVIGSKP